MMKLQVLFIGLLVLTSINCGANKEQGGLLDRIKGLFGKQSKKFSAEEYDAHYEAKTRLSRRYWAPCTSMSVMR